MNYYYQVGYNVSKKYKDDKEKILSMNREEQIEAINRFVTSITNYGY